jgi:hypothetical protein
MFQDASLGQTGLLFEIGRTRSGRFAKILRLDHCVGFNCSSATASAK